ncbi:unnamed protein product [Effrenium voratum]|nr:unnamed protein product [Effrenium voratum]
MELFLQVPARTHPAPGFRSAACRPALGCRISGAFRGLAGGVLGAAGAAAVRTGRGLRQRGFQRAGGVPGAALADLQRIDEFQQKLAYDGFATALLPPEVVEKLRGLAVEAFAEEAAGFQRAKPSAQGFPPRMEWHWASEGTDGKTVFKEAADVLSQYLPNFNLVAAKFIVATGECRPEDARFHQDFESPNVPLLATATALLPIWPLAFPEKEGNLEYYTWDDLMASKKVDATQVEEILAFSRVHRYVPGEAAVFDGKLFHRTQPFSEFAFASEKESEPLSKMRVLVSYYFAQLPPDNVWEGDVRKTLASQGAPIP